MQKNAETKYNKMQNRAINNQEHIPVTSRNAVQLFSGYQPPIQAAVEYMGKIKNGSEAWMRPAADAMNSTHFNRLQTKID